jgi:hypothetical protein
MTDDEFTIPRPRWVVPAAVIGAFLLFLSVVIGSLLEANHDAPAVRFTGATTTTSLVVPDPTVTR